MSGLQWDPDWIAAVRAPPEVMQHAHHCPCCYERWVCDDTCTVWTDLGDALIRLAATVRPPLLPKAAILVLPTGSHYRCDACRAAGREP